MNDAETVTNRHLLIEARLTKAETNFSYMADDIKEIKRNLRWLMGVAFSLNSTIIGLLVKALHLV